MVKQSRGILRLHRHFWCVKPHIYILTIQSIIFSMQRTGLLHIIWSLENCKSRAVRNDTQPIRCIGLTKYLMTSCRSQKVRGDLDCPTHVPCRKFTAVDLATARILYLVIYSREINHSWSDAGVGVTSIIWNFDSTGWIVFGPLWIWL